MTGIHKKTGDETIDSMMETFCRTSALSDTGFVASCTDDVECLDKKTLGLVKGMERLFSQATESQRRRTDRTEQVVWCSSLLLPIHRLPTEILSDIFVHCLPDMHQKPSPNQAPLSLCHVCPAWREIACGLPQLWSHIHIPLSSTSSTGSSRLVDMWRDNARKYPLSLSLTVTAEKLHPAAITMAKDAIQQRSDRLRNLEINVHSIRDVKVFLSNTTINHLETLILTAKDGRGAQSITFFQNIPTLRRVAMNSRSLIHNREYLPLPWSQLTHINLTDTAVPATQWRNIFGQCVSLRHGAFTVLEDTSYGGKSLEPVMLPDLVSLVLESRFRQANPPWFKGITLPALADLDIRFFGPWANDEYLGIQLFSLKRLTLIGISPMSKSEIVALLRSTPLLTDLKIDHNIFDYDGLVDALTCISGSTEKPLLPHLSSLLLVIREIKQLSWAKFSTMVCSRWLPLCVPHLSISRLRSASVIINQMFGEMVNLELDPLLESCIAEGLEVTRLWMSYTIPVPSLQWW